MRVRFPFWIMEIDLKAWEPRAGLERELRWSEGDQLSEDCDDGQKRALV
jgi:hypothetical protein